MVESVLINFLDRAVWILGVQMLGDAWLKIRSEPAMNTDRAVEATVLELNVIAVADGFENRREHFLHILRAAVVGGRWCDRDKHTRRIPKMLSRHSRG